MPGRYVAFLRSGDPRLLAQIVEHNRLDLVSLGVLAGLTCQHVRDGATAGTDPEQALGLGRIYERVGWRDATITCYRRAARTDGTPATRAEALRRLALHHRRGQRHVEAADAWQRVAGTTGACSGAAAGGERCAGRVSRASGRATSEPPSVSPSRHSRPSGIPADDRLWSTGFGVSGARSPPDQLSAVVCWQLGSKGL